MAITFRNAASANANTVAITTPAAKDIILVFAFDNAAATVPTLPAGYTSISSTTTTLLGGIAAYRISDGTETSVPAFTNATNIAVAIYRGVFTPGASANNVGNSAAVGWATITPQNASGSSWVAGGSCAKGATAGMNGTTAALTSNRTNQTTVNALDTNAGVASFAAQTLNVTGSGRWITFSVELRAMPDIAETLTLTEKDLVQLQGGSFQYNLINSTTSSTVATDTAGSESINNFIEKVNFVDTNKAAFGRFVDVNSNSWADSVKVVLGIVELFSDTMTQNEGALVQLQGGSFQYNLFDPVGQDTVATGTAGSESINNWQDPTFNFSAQFQVQIGCPHLGQNWADAFVQATISKTFSDTLTMSDAFASLMPISLSFSDTLVLSDSASNETLDYLLALFCPELSNLWNDRAPDFVLAPSQASISDFTPWSQVQLPGNIAPFDYINYVLGGGSSTELANLGDNGAFRWADNFAFTLTTGGALTEVLSDTLTMSDGLTVGYGEANVEQLTFSDSNALGYGFLINDTLTLSDSTILVFGLTENISEQLTISDSQRLGYGFLISDTMTLSDSIALLFNINLSVSETLTISDSQSLGYGFLISDTMTLTDSTFIAFGINLNVTETLSISDSQSLGYGFLITDTMTLSDSTILVFGLTENITETLTISDSQRLGYGFLISDTMTLSDSLAIGYGLVFSDTMTLSDSMVGLMSIAGTFADQIVMSDSNALGYGFMITDSLSLSDSTFIVFGINLNVTETLTISDSQSLGYGFLISDTMTLSDSIATLLSIAEILSDTMTMSDSMALGYGDVIAEQLVMSDFAAIGEGNLFSDTLVLSDSSSLGYGLLTSDQMTFSDSVIDVLGLVEVLSDTLTMSDSMALGYGDLFSDQLTLSDFMQAGVGNLFNDTLVLSDSASMGYGLLTADQMTMSDSDIVVLGFAFLFSDTLTLSDSLILGIGEGLTEQFVFSDNQTLGYGLLISDNLNNWADSFVFNSGGGEIENLSDTLTMSDSLAAGYGNANVEQLVFSDNQSLGYGDLIAESMSFSDSELNVLGLVETLADTLTLSDRLAIGYGNALADALTLSDSLIVGYGNFAVEQLIFADSQSLGYGDLIADTLSLSDSVQIAIVESESFTETLTITDSMRLGYGLVISETLTLSDAMALGIGEGIVEQLILVDSQGLGYGDIISDNLNNWLDAFQFSTGQPIISLVLSDSEAMSDSMGAGYGCAASEAMTMQEAVKFIESFQLLVVDATPSALDALLALMAGALAVNDSMLFQEQCAIGYGLLIGVDQMTLADSAIVNPVTTLFLALADSESAAWLEALLFELVFAPGAITLGMLKVLNEIVMSALSNQGQIAVAQVDQTPTLEAVVGGVSNQGRMSFSEVTVEPVDAGEVEVLI